jgi:hypothetical protein
MAGLMTGPANDRLVIGVADEKLISAVTDPPIE